MDPAVKVALISAAGVALSSLIAFLGVRATQRQAAAATRTQATTRTQELEAATWDRLQKMYQGALDELEDQIAACRAEQKEQREQHRSEIQALQNRIDVMELRRDADTMQIRLLQSYVRRLLAVVRGSGMTAPEPPEGLVLEHID